MVSAITTVRRRGKGEGNGQKVLWYLVLQRRRRRPNFYSDLNGAEFSGIKDELRGSPIIPDGDGNGGPVRA